MLDGLTRGGNLGLGMLVTLIAAAAADSTGDPYPRGLPGREWYRQHDLRTGNAHRLRREDPPGYSRGHRRAPLGMRRINTWGWSRTH
jgi:hypothetical protein